MIIFILIGALIFRFGIASGIIPSMMVVLGSNYWNPKLFLFASVLFNLLPWLVHYRFSTHHRFLHWFRLFLEWEIAMGFTPGPGWQGAICTGKCFWGQDVANYQISQILSAAIAEVDLFKHIKI